MESKAIYFFKLKIWCSSLQTYSLYAHDTLEEVAHDLGSASVQKN